jgi:hypothetical protein
MSGESHSNLCPVCGEEMDCYSNYKPYDMVGGECIHCGFAYYTKIEQMGLEEINGRREEYNENYEEEIKDGSAKELKPLTQKDLNKYKKEINNL